MKEKTVYVVRWMYRDIDGDWMKGGVGGIFGSKRLAEQFKRDNREYSSMITTMTMYEEDDE